MKISKKKLLDIFQNITDEIESAIKESTFIKHLKKGTILLEEGDITNECFFCRRVAIDVTAERTVMKRQFSFIPNNKRLLPSLMPPKQLLNIIIDARASSSVFLGARQSRRAIAQYLSGRGKAQYFNVSALRAQKGYLRISLAQNTPTRSDVISGDHISTALIERLRAGSRARRTKLTGQKTSLFRALNKRMIFRTQYADICQPE